MFSCGNSFSSKGKFGSSAASVGLPFTGEQVVAEERLWTLILGGTERYAF